MINFTRIEGRDRGEIVLYALSTCVWCRKTRHLLDSLGVAYSYIYVDLLDLAEQDQVMKNVAVHNPSRSFPTLIVNGTDVVKGFDEKRINELLC
jgi:glutaredoxin-like protein NrdH